MNRLEGRGGSREAKIRYLDGDFQILMPGTHVICAMTGETVPVPPRRVVRFRPGKELADKIQ